MEKITEKNETSDFDELTKKMEEEILKETMHSHIGKWRIGRFCKRAFWKSINVYCCGYGERPKDQVMQSIPHVVRVVNSY